MGSIGPDLEAVVALPLIRRASASEDRDESTLIQSAQAGSENAIETLIVRHWDAAFRNAFLILGDAALAEDVAQEAMLAAIRSLDRFDHSRAFRPWLHRVVANRAIDELRRAQARRETSVAEVLSAEGAQADPGPLLADDLVVAIRGLAAIDRAIIVLRFLGEFTATEIASVLEMTPTAVRTRLHRALARLRITLEEPGDG